MNTGWTPLTPFESECFAYGLVPSQVAVALNFGRDLLDEAKQAEEDEFYACNDNGIAGSCGCSACNGTKSTNNPIPF